MSGSTKSTGRRSALKPTDEQSEEEAGNAILPASLSKSDGVPASQTDLKSGASSGTSLMSQDGKGSSKSLVKSSSSVAIGSSKHNVLKPRPIVKNNFKKLKSNSSNAEKVDDQMNYEHLKELEKIFEETKTEGADGLSMDQFRVAMKMTMGEHIDDRQLDLMFMKVDNNCDGTVDWDEYLSYMLLEYQEKENMFTMDMVKPFPNPMVEKSTNHIESICRITMLQATSSRANLGDTSDADDAASRYLTLSKEGVLNVWNLEWHLQKTMNLRGNAKSIWFTDLTCMANCNSFVVSSSEYEISFYTITSNLIQKKFQIKGFQCCALTLDYSSDRTNSKKSLLLWGDTGGNIFVIRFYENPTVALFSNSKYKGGKCTLDQMLKRDSPHLKVFKISDVHSDWVQQVRYFANKKGQECFLSCCVREETALFFADITEDIKQKRCINRKSYFQISKGVLCLTYDEEWNLIVTGSRDCDVRVWNPFIIQRSLAVLKGHHSAILQVLLRRADHQVISISKEYNIRIWDLRYYSCKQSINGRNVTLGRLGITSAYFHDRHKELILGTNRIGVFQPTATSSVIANRKQATSHQKAVTCVLYNKLFHQIVTGGEDSMVCMWDMATGKKSMQFCAEKGVEITSMTFDPTWRRLVTGLRNGATMLWNFNNGACLRRLTNSDGLEISDVVFSKQRIVTAGWAKQPIVYMDSYTDDRCLTLNRKHGDDIMTLDYHRRDAILASAAYDGDIYLWSLETQGVIVAFNMHKSLLPLHISSRSNTHKEDGDRNKSLTFSETLQHDSTSTESGSKDGSGDTGGTPPKVEKEKHNKIRQKRSSENNRKVEFTASGTEISKADTWLPETMPWLRCKDAGENHPKKVHFANDVSENDDSDDEELLIEEEESFTITDKAVYKLLFLQARPNCENTAMLLASNAQGWITAWSVHSRGGLLGYFHATKQENEMVITMVTDSNDHILITGDSRGYIRVWDIEEYCNGSDVVRNRRLQDERAGRRDASAACPMVTYHYLPRTSHPELQASFRGHVRAVTSVSFIERHGLIASGSVDCSVRLWTLHGRYIGTFGQKIPWSIEFPLVPSLLSSVILEDVRRVASTTTLKTIKGGFHTQWKQVKNAVNLAGRTFDFSSPSKVEEKKRKMSARDRLASVEHEILEESAKKPGSRRKSVTVWLDDIPHAIGVVKKSTDEVENSFQRLQANGISSSVLGKTNYKPKKRHRESKINKEIKWFNQHAAIYNSLPYQQLDQPIQPTLPDYIKQPPTPPGPVTTSLYSAIVRQKAVGNWSRKALRATKKPSSAFRNVVSESDQEKVGAADNQSSEQKLPVMTPTRTKKLTKKAKYVPLALPSIAT